MSNEWEYIKDCLDSNWVSSTGPYVDRFEQDMAKKIGLPFAVAATNGTAALHLTLMALGIEVDDEVVKSTLTFISPVNTIRYVNAHPVLIDAEMDTWQMDPQKVGEFLNEHCSKNKRGDLINKVTGRRVSALMPVHILGDVVDMDPILTLAKHFELPVIEDATEALGTKYRWKKSRITR